MDDSDDGLVRALAEFEAFVDRPRTREMLAANTSGSIDEMDGRPRAAASAVWTALHALVLLECWRRDYAQNDDGLPVFELAIIDPKWSDEDSAEYMWVVAELQRGTIRASVDTLGSVPDETLKMLVAVMHSISVSVGEPS